MDRNLDGLSGGLAHVLSRLGCLRQGGRWGHRDRSLQKPLRGPRSCQSGEEVWVWLCRCWHLRQGSSCESVWQWGPGDPGSLGREVFCQMLKTLQQKLASSWWGEGLSVASVEGLDRSWAGIPAPWGSAENLRQKVISVDLANVAGARTGQSGGGGPDTSCECHVPTETEWLADPVSSSIYLFSLGHPFKCYLATFFLIHSTNIYLLGTCSREALSWVLSRLVTLSHGSLLTDLPLSTVVGR